jgi:NADP-dependent 3-hydroxy acid dehydrogenase YdfG
MDIALVTGANTRIGLAISRKLIETGCRVYGLGSTFNDFPLEHSDFIPVTCDLTNTEHLCQVVQEIIDKEKNIYILVNHARYLNLEPHEKLGLNDLESLVHTNLLAPLILTRLALPSLIQLRGYVLNIGFPDLPGSQRLGSAFLSTEVALQQFSDRLYEEVRQDKVKVCSLILDTGNAEAMFKEGFTERDNHDLILCSEATAQAVEYIISQKRESVVSTLVVRPQKREPDEKDRAGARKLAAPTPYSSKKPVKKVVFGRLQKKEKVKKEVKGPATYMDMVREVAEEESRQAAIQEKKPPQIDQDKREPISPPNRRRRRRRSRGRSPRDPHTNASENPDKHQDGKQSEKTKQERPSGKSIKKETSRPRAESPKNLETTANKQVTRKKVAKKEATKRADKKVAASKKGSNASAKKPVPRKTVTKKMAAKRPAKKAVEKTFKKRSTPKKKAI